MRWVIQESTIVGLPDDAPIPEGSYEIELTEDFREHPERYRVGKTGLTRLSDAKIASLAEQRAAARLTAEDVDRIKKAIREERI